jgi:hypothetical protein
MLSYDGRCEPSYLGCTFPAPVPQRPSSQGCDASVGTGAHIVLRIGRQPGNGSAADAYAARRVYRRCNNRVRLRLRGGGSSPRRGGLMAHPGLVRGIEELTDAAM